MIKNFCDNCDNEIDENSGFFILKYNTKDRDYGLVYTLRTYELCSLKCLSSIIDELKEQENE